MILLLTGPIRSGKTTAAARLVVKVRATGGTVGGILCPGELIGARRTRIDVEDQTTGRRAVLADRLGPGVEQVGGFHFTAAGLALGRAALDRAVRDRPRLAVLDELGPLELAGGGWSEGATASIETYRADPDRSLVILLRRNVLDAAVARWGMEAVPVCRSAEAEPALRRLSGL